MNKYHLQIGRTLKGLNGSVSPAVQKLSEILHHWDKNLSPFVRKLEHLSQAITPVAMTVAKYFKTEKKISATGWLLYHSVPISIIEECGENIPLIEETILCYYKTHWKEIRQEIESELEKYHIDEEARATFREALSAHENGYYRCVCRVLFPEIERALRVRFYEGQFKHIASKKMIEKLVRDKSLDDLNARETFGMILFGRLVQHLYESVEDKKREKFESDFIPNRHAALHGLVPYSTYKHSMNMIIMADYIFHIFISKSDSPSLPQ